MKAPGGSEVSMNLLDDPVIVDRTGHVPRRSTRVHDALEDSQLDECDPLAGTTRPLKLEGADLPDVDPKGRGGCIRMGPIGDSGPVGSPLRRQDLPSGPAPAIPRITPLRKQLQFHPPVMDVMAEMKKPKLRGIPAIFLE
jgi:hypothetical protein